MPNTKDNVLSFLQDEGNNNWSSTIPDTSHTLQCKLVFPADCWDFARIVGMSMSDTLDRGTVKSYTVIQRFVDFLSSSNANISEINFSGLYRPFGGSTTSPHIFGRGIDIRALRFSNGDGIVFNYTAAPHESALAAAVRTHFAPNIAPVTQYLSPWSMCGEGGVAACVPNTGATPLQRGHRDHLHITVSP